MYVRRSSPMDVLEKSMNQQVRMIVSKASISRHELKIKELTKIAEKLTNPNLGNNMDILV